MGWPSLRFEKFYDSYQKRMVVEELTTRKISMINALYSNTNYDGKENSGQREKIIAKLENQFNEVVSRLYSGRSLADEAEEDSKNPFLQASKRAIDRLESPHEEE